METTNYSNGRYTVNISKTVGDLIFTGEALIYDDTGYISLNGMIRQSGSTGSSININYREEDGNKIQRNYTGEKELETQSWELVSSIVTEVKTDYATK